MKVDRMLEIIIYLLNHDNVPASYLAERFQVSVRTIQRDMISISAAGIPVYALGGKNGGYSILPTFRVKNANIRSDEQQMIARALESLSTSYTNSTLQSLIEKYNVLVEKEGGQKIFWDFGVTKENRQVQDLNAELERAISGRHFVQFDYRSANGRESHKRVEPLAIHYKWYAWYLFAYSPEKERYGTYKVARIKNLRTEEAVSAMAHGDVRQLMLTSEQDYYKTCIRIEVHFAGEEISLMEEYFPDCPPEAIGEDQFRIFIEVPAKERLWKALLLSFGDRVRVVGPADYREELIETAKKFLSGNESAGDRL